MKLEMRIVGSLLGLLLSVSALRLVERDPDAFAQPRVVTVDIAKGHPARHLTPRDRAYLTKRQSNTVSQELDNTETLYFANITLGTPPQQVRVTIDTGSSDLWVNTPNSTLCTKSRRSCAAGGGTFSPDDSSSVNVINENFNISYADGTTSGGSYLSDNLGFGNVQLNDFQFGVGYQSSSIQGVLGIGYQTNEVQVNRFDGRPYPNLPYALANAGFVNSPAYSLWLNDLDASSGSILFGGVNTEKYVGSLTSLPIVAEGRGQYRELLIALTGVELGGDSVNVNSLPSGALLDSGTTLMYLPIDITRQIYSAVSAAYDAASGFAWVPCSLANANFNITFTFSGPSIAVPMNELVLAAETFADQPQTFEDGTPACPFGIVNSDLGISILGDTFLRSAYVVYDLENNEISLAQTNFNSTRDNIREIASGTSAVPDATDAPSPVTTLAIAPGAARDALAGANSATSVSTTSTSNVAAPTAHAKGGLAAGALGLIVAAAF